MLKKFTFRKLGITTLLLLLALILYNYPENINKEIDTVKDVKYINIYLLDKDDLVSMTKIVSDSKNEDNIGNLLESLVEGNSNLPTGFRGLIPEGTKILGYKMDSNNSLLKINFSKELLNVSIENEEHMIEAIIYSLCNLKNVKKIMIFVDGEILEELPNSHKKLGNYLDKSYGINKVIDIDSITGSKMINVYYLNKINDLYYYVPVSYITNDKKDTIQIIINNLKTNKLNSSNLSSHLNYQVKLINYDMLENEINLQFNEALLDSVYNGRLEEEVKYAIFYSIYDTLGIENVVFQVNSEEIDEFRLEN